MEGPRAGPGAGRPPPGMGPHRPRRGTAAPPARPRVVRAGRRRAVHRRAAAVEGARRASRRRLGGAARRREPDAAGRGARSRLALLARAGPRRGRRKTGGRGDPAAAFAGAALLRPAGGGGARREPRNPTGPRGPLPRRTWPASARIPAVGRAIALYRVEMNAEAFREWVFALRAVDDRGLLAASEVALQAGLADRAIGAADRTASLHDFARRYPIHHREPLAAAARQWNVDEALLFGIIRQESRFNAGSEVARGGDGAHAAHARHRALGGQADSRAVLPARPAHAAGRERHAWAPTISIASSPTSATPSSPRRATTRAPAGRKRWRDAKPLEGATYAESIPFDETRDYVKKVMANAWFYSHRLTGKTASLRAMMGTVPARGAGDAANVAVPAMSAGARVLVLGASGFVGRSVCARLGAAGFAVRVLTRGPPQVAAPHRDPLPRDLRGEPPRRRRPRPGPRRHGRGGEPGGHPAPEPARELREGARRAARPPRARLPRRRRPPPGSRERPARRPRRPQRVPALPRPGRGGAAHAKAPGSRSPSSSRPSSSGATTASSTCSRGW